MNNELVSIDKISRQSGLASSALRYYERCGLISAGVKVGGRRHYPLSILHRLSVIKVCQSVGFSLAEIAELLNGTPGQDGTWRELARLRRQEIQDQIRRLNDLSELLDSAMRCPCTELPDCPSLAPQGDLARRTSEHHENSPGIRGARQLHPLG